MFNKFTAKDIAIYFKKNSGLILFLIIGIVSLIVCFNMLKYEGKSNHPTYIFDGGHHEPSFEMGEIIDGATLINVINIANKTGFKVYVKTGNKTDDYTNCSYEKKISNNPDIKFSGRAVEKGRAYAVTKILKKENGQFDEIDFELVKLN